MRRSVIYRSSSCNLRMSIVGRARCCVDWGDQQETQGAGRGIIAKAGCKPRVIQKHLVAPHYSSCGRSLVIQISNLISLSDRPSPFFSRHLHVLAIVFVWVLNWCHTMDSWCHFELYTFVNSSSARGRLLLEDALRWARVCVCIAWNLQWGESLAGRARCGDWRDRGARKSTWWLERQCWSRSILHSRDAQGQLWLDDTGGGCVHCDWWRIHNSWRSFKTTM